jgi:hypothetical protein
MTARPTTPIADQTADGQALAGASCSLDFFGVEDRIMPRAFSHDRVEKTKHEWLTPPEILNALGTFDLDPCAPVPERRPWSTAGTHYDIRDNGLMKPWSGRVWLNPPYENDIAGAFLGRMCEHGNGIVLIFARVETANWFNFIWGKADAILFVRGRIRFCHATGKPADGGGGAPSALIAYGTENVEALKKSGIEGHLVILANV